MVLPTVSPPHLQPELNGDAAATGTCTAKVTEQIHIEIPSNGYHLPLTNILSSTYLPQNGQHAISGLSRGILDFWHKYLH